MFSGYDEATSRCEEEDYSLLDHLTPGSTKFVTSKVDQDRTGSKSLMIWLGTQRQRTSNFRGEEWRWQSSKQKVASLDWAKGQPNNYNQARCSNSKKLCSHIFFLRQNIKVCHCDFTVFYNNFLDRVRILAGHRACHVTYLSGIFSLNLMLHK